MCWQLYYIYRCSLTFYQIMHDVFYTRTMRNDLVCNNCLQWSLAFSWELVQNLKKWVLYINVQCTRIFVYIFFWSSVISLHLFIERMYLKCGNVDQHITQNSKLLIYFTLPWLLYMIGTMKTSRTISWKTCSDFSNSF